MLKLTPAYVNSVVLCELDDETGEPVLNRDVGPAAKSWTFRDRHDEWCRSIGLEDWEEEKLWIEKGGTDREKRAAARDED